MVKNQKYHEIFHVYYVLPIVLRSSWSKAFLVKSLNVLLSNGYKKGGKWCRRLGEK